MTDNTQLPQITTTNNIIPDVSLTKQDLGQQTTQYLDDPSPKNYEKIYYERLNVELKDFNTKLEEVNKKNSSNAEKITLLNQSYQEFCNNLDAKIDGRIMKKLEEKKFATEEDIKEIKSNKKFYIGLMLGAIPSLIATAKTFHWFDFS